jgi:hypothetical protein
MPSRHACSGAGPIMGVMPVTWKKVGPELFSREDQSYEAGAAVAKAECARL